MQGFVPTALQSRFNAGQQEEKCLNILQNPGQGLISTLLLPQGACDVAQVQGVGWYRGLPAALWCLAGVNVHRLGNRVHRAFAEVSKSLSGVLLADALLEGFALVPELDDSLGVGVDGGNRSAHAAGEGGPGHARERHSEGTGLCLFAGIFYSEIQAKCEK